MLRLVALLLALSMAGPAVAQPVGVEPQSTPAPLSSSSYSARFTPAETVVLSLGTTAALVGAGVVLEWPSSYLQLAAVLGGLAVGPSVGNLALGSYEDALRGGGFRLVGVGLLACGALAGIENACIQRADLSTVSVLLIGGAVAVVVGTTYDLTTAAATARRAGRVQVLPGVDATGAPGAVLQVRL